MTSAVRAGQLHPEEVACLVGGPWRVAEVAVAALAVTGSARISRDGVVSAVLGGGARTGPQAAVLARSGQALGDVVAGVAGGPEARSVPAELVRRGLVRTPGRRRAVSLARPPALLVAVLAAVCAFVLEVLVPVALVVLVAGVVLNVVLLLQRGPLTRAGRRVLRQARAVPPGVPDGQERVVAARGLLGRHSVPLSADARRSLAGAARRRGGKRSAGASGGAGCGSGHGGGFSSCGTASGSGDSGGGSGCGGGCGGGGGD
ncbi:TIGR04222 domain-containing membrane protein [Actinosynnema mirum]|uniref:TIGR04222 domain-containing membrane protein n=1 Tax=Actinosynnema mirum (strain ATCC 29888 / DSM 43827 / JCM 3225 / NBRC 14064 / NCIMB 13271 / NRRL B-12336 / IMRU 3971 / 101) TaxID=446462 RepID=C6WBE1_ACTMD|nr:TIGR04222 domain-containing membrane protein [Actinosynnema mirum]ACU35509.1 hypothetical protein Amir_1560 [Actinosynnema mirum DSM 43827]